jgi:hypothetical protein
MGQICRKSDYTDQRKELYAVGEKNWDMMGRFFWLESIIAPKQRNIPV